MNRAQKIALLTRVLQGEAPRQRLQLLVDAAPDCLIIIDDLDEPGKGFADNDPVYFHVGRVKHEMTLGEAHQYAHRHRIYTLFILPEKK